MQSRKNLLSFAAAFLAVAMIGAAASNAAVMWTPASGSLDDYAYSNGQSDFGYFGNPTIVGNSFVMSPPSFTATESQTPVTDKIEVTIDAGYPDTIEAITIVETGTYEITGDGAVSAQVSLQAARLMPFPLTVLSEPTANFSETTTGAGTWTLTSTISFPTVAPNQWSMLLLTYRNVLEANATTGTATITKTGATIIVPEPASLAGLALVVLTALRRR